MSQKIFLTSALAMGVFAPAFAEPSHTGTFPADGYMEEDYTYTNAATADNMDSVYEGTVNAVAEYEDVLYQIVAGQYLPAGAESPIDCNQSGYFCAGVQNGVYYDANNNQGLTSCSDATNGAYTLSAGTGTSADSCYRECTTADVEHSRGTLNGGYYYGNNNQCEPTDCVNGWHVKAATPDLMTVIGANEAGTGYTANMGTGSERISDNMSNSIISGDAKAFAVDYGNNKGIVKGHAQCSSQSGINNGYSWTNPTISAALPDSVGQYCYCRLDSYTASGSNTQIALSGSWVFDDDFRAADTCASDCAYDCASYLMSGESSQLAFRTWVFGTIESTPAMCEANVININWSNADAADVTANNAGTATYGSDVRTPVKAQTIKGKTFKGWRFSKPQQTNLP